MNADGGGYELDNDCKRLPSIWVCELNSPEIMPNPNDTTISLEIELLSYQEKQIGKYYLICYYFTILVLQKINIRIIIILFII